LGLGGTCCRRALLPSATGCYLAAKNSENSKARGTGFVAEASLHKGGFGRVEVMTHCNAGWLATVDRGTALAPVYRARNDGVPIHVWVDGRCGAQRPKRKEGLAAVTAVPCE